MNRRAFLTSLAVGLGALYLTMRPESVRALPKFKEFRWECRGTPGNFMVMTSPDNPPSMPELLDAERMGWLSVTMTTVWNESENDA